MLVDYTHAAVVAENVRAAVERGVGVVVGSSGLGASDYEQIDALARAREVGVVAAGNFSLSAALVLRFAAEAALHLERWEIVDYASATKPDAPSGTAREIAERLAEVRAPLVDVPLDDVLGAPEARGATIAGTQVHSLRLPGFVVSTEVLFAAPGERLDAPPRRGRQPRAVRLRDAARDPRRARARRPDTRARPAASRLGAARDSCRPLGRDQQRRGCRRPARRRPGAHRTRCR